jgi:hypothetical protein
MGDTSWTLVGWDVALVCLIALEVAAETVAPLAENHAGRQRFLALLLWLPLPIMRWRSVSEPAQFAQLVLFVCVAGLLIWYHLSVRPMAVQSQRRPFRGWRGVFGLPFQPGWPSAVVFLLIEVALYVHSMPNLPPAGNPSLVLAWALMSSAALLCSTCVWVVLRPRARFPLLLETLFSFFCGVAVALMLAGKAPQMHLGEEYWFGFIPAVGLWAMLDQAYTYSTGVRVTLGRGDPSEAVALNWLHTAYFALGAYALLLLVWSRQYWIHYIRNCLALARPAPRPDEPPAPTSSEP